MKTHPVRRNPVKQDVPHFLSVRGPDVRNLVSRQESSFGGPSSKMYCNCCEREITPPTENHYSEETQKLKQQTDDLQARRQ